MKGLITLIICLACFTVQAQQYTIAADTNTCRMTITNGGGELREMFLVDYVRYTDRGNEINIFDDMSNFREKNTKIVSHASLAALKADIDIWIEACR